MSQPSPEPDAAAPAALKLPDLNQAKLDWAGVEALLRDIEACVQLTDVIVKAGPDQFVPENQERLTLPQVREILRQRSARAVQLRYQYEGAEWWDTLMILPDGWKLIRIRHEFPPAAPSA